MYFLMYMYIMYIVWKPIRSISAQLSYDEHGCLPPCYCTCGAFIMFMSTVIFDAG